MYQARLDRRLGLPHALYLINLVSDGEPLFERRNGCNRHCREGRCNSVAGGRLWVELFDPGETNPLKCTRLRVLID